MQNAAHPVTTEVPPGYDGTTSWFKYSDAVENGVTSQSLKPSVVMQTSQPVYWVEQSCSKKGLIESD